MVTGIATAHTGISDAPNATPHNKENTNPLPISKLLVSVLLYSAKNITNHAIMRTRPKNHSFVLVFKPCTKPLKLVW